MKPIQYPDPRIYQVGDWIHCDGSPGDSSAITRIVTGPPSEPWYKRMVDHNISVHTGMIAKFGGQFFVVEMRPNGCENNAPEFYRVPFGQKPRRILAVTRPRLLNPSLRAVLNEVMALDVRRGIEYALKDLPRFVSERIKEDKRRMYCSEYVFLTSSGKELTSYLPTANVIPGRVNLVPDAPTKFYNLVAPQWLMGYAMSSDYHETIYTRSIE